MSYDEATRARIAQGWANSSLDQATYAARAGISPRTLRAWVAKYAAGQPPAERARAVIGRAIAELQALLAAFDAELACRPAEATGDDTGTVTKPVEPARSAEPTESQDEPPAGQADKSATPALQPPRLEAQTGMPKPTPLRQEAEGESAKVQPRKKRGSWFAEFCAEREPSGPESAEAPSTSTASVEPASAPPPPSVAACSTAAKGRPKPLPMPSALHTAW